MPCVNCGAEKTIKAHLIPQAFAREVRGEGSDHALTTSDISNFNLSKNGLHDKNILCSVCDNKIGAYEKYAFETLKDIRSQSIEIVDRTFVAKGVEGDRLLRFAMGIAWKYSLTVPHYGRIEIGPYSAKLGACLFDENEFLGCINAFVLKMHSGDDDSYFYRAPLTQKYDGINFVRFTVGGFIFMLKLDQRMYSPFPSQVWFKGNSNILIPAVPMDCTTEGQSFLGARRTNRRLDSAIRKIVSRVATR